MEYFSKFNRLTGLVILSTVLSAVLDHSLCLLLGKLAIQSFAGIGKSSNQASHRWSTLDSILLQFPLGGVVFIFILLTGYISSRIPNIRLLLLVLCCLPVIAGCAMIWRSEWTHRAAAPVAGYTLIGFFGPVVSLIISIGMANVAGATKKSFTAAAIFVAYCVGNVCVQSDKCLMRTSTNAGQIVGPQLIRTPTLKRHYPELWLGLIIWSVHAYDCLFWFILGWG